MEEELETYRKRIERRFHERRLKNARRTAYQKPKFWDAGMIINSIALGIMALWFYIAMHFTGGAND